MKGEHVIVRAYGGVPLIRRVWEENERVVFITDDKQFELLFAEKPAIEAIGFPREDVFNYDVALAKKAEKLHRGGKWDRNKLNPY